jgi:hypothetical protein
MNDSMVDRLDDQEPVTITEALEIPHPRAVGSPLPRGNGNRVSVPPTYAELEDRASLSHPGPVLAPPASFPFSSPLLRSAGPAAIPAAVKPDPAPLGVNIAPEPVPVPAPAAPAPVKAAAAPQSEQVVPPGLKVAPHAAPEHRVPTQKRVHHPSTLQRAAGIIRSAIPVVQKLLPLLDGNIGSAMSNLLNPTPPPPAPPASTALVAPPPAPPKLDLAPVLTPFKENIAELKSMQSELQLTQKDLQATNVQLRDQISEQNMSLKRVEDHLELVREATDRNTLEQQELMEDLKSMGSRVNVVAAIAIGLLTVSLLVNLFLFMHIQRVLP